MRRSIRLASRRLDNATLWAEGRYDAGVTFGLLRVADPSAVPDQQLMSVKPPALVDEFGQVAFNLVGRVMGAQSHAARKSHHVGVDGKSSGAAQVHRNHASGFLPNARQLGQKRAFGGHVAVIPFDQPLPEGDEVLRLVAKEPDALNVRFEVGRLREAVVLGRLKSAKQRRGDQIDTLVGGLG